MVRAISISCLWLSAILTITGKENSCWRFTPPAGDLDTQLVTPPRIRRGAEIPDPATDPSYACFKSYLFRRGAQVQGRRAREDLVSFPSRFARPRCDLDRESAGAWTDPRSSRIQKILEATAYFALSEEKNQSRLCQREFLH